MAVLHSCSKKSGVIPVSLSVFHFVHISSSLMPCFGRFNRLKHECQKQSFLIFLITVFLSVKKTITFKYDGEWCSPPNWPKQILGMMNYIDNFQMEDAIRGKVMRLISRMKAVNEKIFNHYLIGITSI